MNDGPSVHSVKFAFGKGEDELLSFARQLSEGSKFLARTLASDEDKQKFFEVQKYEGFVMSSKFCVNTNAIVCYRALTYISR